MESRLITWEEIKRRTSSTDHWIVIDKKVYDVSKWRNRHPGGSFVLDHYRGQDATEAFTVSHPNLSIAQKYLKQFYIGDVDPVVSDPVLADRLAKKDACVKDFLNLHTKLYEMGLFTSSKTFYASWFIQVAGLEALAFLNLFYYGTSWPRILLSVLLYTTSQAQATYLQHDLVHGGVFRSTQMSHLFHKIVLGLARGTSPHWLRSSHARHHSKTNIIDKDPEVNLEPLFVIGSPMTMRAASEENKQKKHLPYQYQDKYFFLLGPLFYFTNQQYQSLRFIKNERCWEDLALIASFYAKLFILYWPLLGFWGTIAYLIVVRILDGHWYLWTARASHTPMDIRHDSEESWLPLQVRSTQDMEQSLFNDWFTGHVNFQLEHHLFPTMPSHNLVKAQPYVQDLCRKHNIPHMIKPMGTAVGEVVRTLKKWADVWRITGSGAKAVD